jgi:hypothetical protein
MAKQTENPSSPSSPTEQRDLSADIAATVERQPGDLVRCTWIGGSSYRVNWWSARETEGYDNPAVYGQTYGTHVIRKSRFVRVTSTPQGLSIHDAAAADLVRGILR